MQMPYEIKNFTPRAYQKSILNSAISKNTLVVLPTGMGKTKIAILTIISRFNLYPSTKAIILTPTKPLANQIRKEFVGSTNIEEDFAAVLTGETPPAKREKIISTAKLIVSTPQTITNDIVNGRINLEEFSTLILDEAHRNVKEYDYTWICRQYKKTARFPRIVGLTASPGSNLDSVQEVCKKAYIEEIEVRAEDDIDVAPYTQELNTEWVKLDLPESYKQIQAHLNACTRARLQHLRSLNTIGKAQLTKKELLDLLKHLHGKLARGEKDFQVLKSISLTAEAIKLSHATELLETQGINSLYIYLKRIYEEAEKTKTKAIKNLVKDQEFHSAFIKTRELHSSNDEHPKLKKLKEMIKEAIASNPKIKTIVFSQYREQAKEIENQLNKIENVKARMFVGQTKKRDTGLSQKEQLKILESFRNSEINILISTSIGEEGLDIPRVDHVIFYEPIPSAIRSIQRRGRTARHETGKLTVLMTKNTRDEAYHWIAYNKEKTMASILKDLKSKITMQEQKSIPDEFKPASLKIIADTREQSSQVIKELVNLNIKVETRQLDIADYIIASEIGIERKEVRDFVASIIDKRLLNQIRELRNNFLKPLLIVEGSEDVYEVRKIHPNAIRGMLSAIALDFHVPIIYTKSQIETASLLKTILERTAENKTPAIPLRLERKPLTTRELQEYIIESLPGIGPATAKSLLASLKSIKNIINADEQQLKEIEGIGNKKAEEIKKIIEEEY